jgi:uncharacterized cupin superfamily protein
MATPFRKKLLDRGKRRKGRAHEPFRVEDVPRVEWSAGRKFGGTVRSPGEFGGRERIGVHLEELAPGQWNGTFHWHTHEEEHFWILEGEGTFRIGKRRHKVRGGEYVVFPPNGRVAHALRNTGRKPLRYLVIGTRESGDICVYPDSKKIAISPLKSVGRFQKTDYWEGEV